MIIHHHLLLLFCWRGLIDEIAFRLAQWNNLHCVVQLYYYRGGRGDYRNIGIIYGVVRFKLNLPNQNIDEVVIKNSKDRKIPLHRPSDHLTKVTYRIWAEKAQTSVANPKAKKIERRSPNPMLKKCRGRPIVTILKAITSWDKFESQTTKLKSWLSQILGNLSWAKLWLTCLVNIWT